MEEQTTVQVQSEVTSPRKKSNLLDKLFTWVLVAMATLIPAAFFWRTFEYFESAKNVILIFGTFTLVILWIIKSSQDKEFKIKRTPFDIPILIWLGVSLLSTVFSDVVSTSILGYFSRLTGGFIHTLSLALLYFVVVNNVKSGKEMKMIVSAFLSSVSLMLLYGILRFFGVFQAQIESLAADHPTLLFLQSASANPLANASVAPFLAVITVVLGLGWMLREMDMVKKLVSAGFVLVGGLFLGISAFNELNYQNVALIVLAVFAVFVILFMNRKKLVEETLYILLIVGIVVTAFGLVVNVPSLKESFGVDSSFSKPPVLRPDFSWIVTTSGIADRRGNLLPKSFFFGRGQETYPFSFTMYKPLEINETDLWNIKFSLPSMEIERVIHDTGLVGLAVFMFVTLALVKVIRSLKKDKGLMADSMVASMVLTAGLLILAHLAVFFSAAMFFIFWLLLAYVGTLATKDDAKYLVLFGKGTGKEMGGTVAFALAVVAVVVIGGLSFIIVKNYYAEMLFRRGYNAHFISGDYDYAVASQEAALKYSDREYIHRMLALSSLNKGITLLKEENPNAEAQLKKSVDEIAEAQKKNPYYVETVEAEVTIYSIMVNLTRGKEYGGQLLDAVNRAVTLDPKNPDKLINLGIINNAVGNKELAESQLITAYSYRQDYWKSIVALAEYWAVNEKKTDAVDLLNKKLPLFEAGSIGYEAISDSLARIQNAAVEPKETPSDESDVNQEPGGDVTNQEQK